jgi:hypothetical protein
VVVLVSTMESGVDGKDTSGSTFLVVGLFDGGRNFAFRHTNCV